MHSMFLPSRGTRATRRTQRGDAHAVATAFGCVIAIVIIALACLGKLADSAMHPTPTVTEQLAAEANKAARQAEAAVLSAHTPDGSYLVECTPNAARNSLTCSVAVNGLLECRYAVSFAMPDFPSVVGVSLDSVLTPSDQGKRYPVVVWEQSAEAIPPSKHIAYLQEIAGHLAYPEMAARPLYSLTCPSRTPPSSATRAASAKPATASPATPNSPSSADAQRIGPPL